MSNKWSENTTINFVEEYMNHECLWNVNNPLYENKQCCDSAYRTLAETMNMSGFGVPEVKTKIKNLRSTYSQELKKISDSKKSGSGSDFVYTPQVKWFNIMRSFLQGTEKKRSTISNVITPKKTISTDEIDQDISNDDDIMQDSLTVINQTSQESIQECMLSEGNQSKEDQPKTPKFKKTKLQEISSTVKQLQNLTEVLNTEPQENEFQIFGKHIASQLEKLSPINALNAQEKIQSLLTELRIQEIRSTDSSIWEFGRNINKEMNCSAAPSLSSSSSISTFDSVNNYEPIQNVVLQDSVQSDILSTAIMHTFQNM